MLVNPHLTRVSTQPGQAQWRELRADRVEADVMCDIRPAFAGRSHGTNFVARDDARAGTATALRYRTQAQLEVQRATNLLRRHRQDRLAGLIPPFVDEPCTPEPEPQPPEEAAIGSRER